jgi:hypothetical protein
VVGCAALLGFASPAGCPSCLPQLPAVHAGQRCISSSGSAKEAAAPQSAAVARAWAMRCCMDAWS